MNRIKRILKILLQFAVLLLVILLLMAAILQIPAVQQFVTGKLENYLEEQFKTEVNIQSIRLKLPESLAVRGLYIEDSNQDTLLNVEELLINFKLNQLLQKRIQFDYIRLAHGQGNLHWAQDSSNIDFILEAFKSPSDSAPNPVIEKDSTLTPWVMTFNNSTLLLEDINFQFSDETILLKTQVGNLRGSVRDIDYGKNNYVIDQIHLSDSYTNVVMGVSDKIVKDSTLLPYQYQIAANGIHLDNVALDLKMPGMELTTSIGELDNQDLVFNLTEIDQKISTSLLELKNTEFRLDQASAKRIVGFDYNHFGLTNATTKITDFNYHNNDLTGKIEHFSAIDDKGFLVKELQAEVDFSETQIALKNLSLKTTETNIQSANTTVQYPFSNPPENALNQLIINSSIDADSKSYADIRYFYPEWDQLEMMKNVPEKPWKLKAEVSGSLAALNIKTLDFNGLNAKIIASGQLKNLDRPKQLVMNLSIRQFEATGEAIAAFLPKETLPTYVVLPDNISLTGSVKGMLKDFQSIINAKTNRKSSATPTQINARVAIKNVSDWKNATLDIQLDSFRTTNTEILAYLPDGTIPAYMQLPDRFVLSGRVSGPTSNLNSNLALMTYRNEEANQLKAAGNISGLFTSKNPTFDLTLDAASISRQEIEAFLPDSLLPDYFRLPIIKKLTGIIKGDLNNFKTKFQLESNTGDWKVDAGLNDQQYQLDLDVSNLDPDAFFSENYLDTLIGLSFSPWSVNIMLSGNGLNITKEATSNLEVIINDKKKPDSDGLIFSAKLDNQKVRAKAIANEEEIQLTSDIIVDFTKQIPEWEIDMLLEQLDLKKLNWSEVPFALNGRLTGEGKGYTQDTLSGNVLLSDFVIQYQDSTAYVDSFLIAANLLNGNNLLKITSDFLDAKLEGQFQFESTAIAIQQQIYNFWKYEYSDSLIGKTQDRFGFELDLHDPEMLTIGFIPTLEELSPFQGQLKYDNRDAVLSFQITIPDIRYQQMTFRDLSVQGDAKGDELNYKIDTRQALIQKNVDIERLSTFGVLKNKILQNTVQINDEKAKERFVIKSTFHFLEDQGLRFSLNPEQLLNYQNWSVLKDNEILWTKDDLLARNWRFYSGEESVEIRDAGNKQVDILFEKFNLKAISDLVKLNSNTLGGIANGIFSISRPTTELSFSSDLTVDGLFLLGAKLGDLKLSAKDQGGRVVQTSAQLRGFGNEIDINGTINLSNKFDPLNLKVGIPKLNIKNIEPLMMGYLENMVGRLHGAVDVSGSFSAPALIGQVQFDTAALDIVLLKTRLKLGNQPIVFDANAIEFKNLEVLDVNGNKGIMSSFLLTEDYKSFFLQADVSLKDFLVLNTTLADNGLYHGKLIVDAVAHLTGDIEQPTITVTATPKKGSDITYIYNAYSSGAETGEGIVKFITNDEEELRRRRELEKQIKLSNDLNMNITVKISVNDNLEFTVITDPLSGDYFVGKAKGDLVYVQKPGGVMELNGNLETVEGKYLFTYQKVIRRPFNVEPGGSISWTGDPFTPRLDLDVVYQQRTSVYPLLAGQSSGTTAGTIPKQLFLVKLNIGGTPAKTEINSVIEYPQSDGNTNNSEVSAAITRINQDASQQNTQAFSLILFGGFVAQGFESTGFQLVNVTGSINGVITQQLNNLANRYIKFVDIDFGLNSYENADNNAQTDFRVSIRKRFLNDRLSISLDGTTSSETDTEQTSSSAYLDNVTVEYSLTQDGRYKVKIYSKRDFDDFIGGTGVKVGGAFVFSKEFNGIRLKEQ